MVGEAAVGADAALHVAHVVLERLALALGAADAQLDREQLHAGDGERDERCSECVRHPACW